MSCSLGQRLSARVCAHCSVSCHDTLPCMPKTRREIAREVDELLAAIKAKVPLSGTRNVTAQLLRESAEGPGDLPHLVATARPAKNITEVPTLVATLLNLSARHDRSMGYISKPLAYSRAVRGSKREHANLIRLIKGGYVHVCEVDAPPPSDSIARCDVPYSDRHYVLHVGSCGGED